MLTRKVLCLLTAAAVLSLSPSENAFCACRQSSPGPSKPFETAGDKAEPKIDTEGSPRNHGVRTPQAGSTDPRIEKLKQGVHRVGVGGNISVFLKNGDNLHGTVAKIEEDTFQIAEVDLRTIMTAAYKDVKKIRAGYGGISAFTGKRTSWPAWAKPVAIIGALLLIAVPLLIYASQKD